MYWPIDASVGSIVRQAHPTLRGTQTEYEPLYVAFHLHKDDYHHFWAVIETILKYSQYVRVIARCNLPLSLCASDLKLGVPLTAVTAEVIQLRTYGLAGLVKDTYRYLARPSAWLTDAGRALFQGVADAQQGKEGEDD